jgi:hypothetical protein
MLSTHRYPPGDGSVTSFDGAELEAYVQETLQHVGDFPIVAGEHGWSQGSPQPVWLAQLLDYLVTVSIPGGHNGVFAWDWDWGLNALVGQDDYTLTEPGEVFSDHYWQHFGP